MQFKAGTIYHVEITGNTKDNINVDFLETVDKMLTNGNRRHFLN
jgi:hypothetical protein